MENTQPDDEDVQPLTPHQAELESAMSDNETILSEEARLDATRRLAGSQRAVALLDEFLREPLLRRESELSLIASYRAALAPQRKLPNELLSNIFAHCVSGLTEVPATKDKAPWSLSYVCSRWRQVVLAQHDLWRRPLFIIDGFQWDCRVNPGRRYASLMADVLSRTGRSMLSLKFYFKRGRQGDWELRHISQCLISYADRLHELSILEKAGESQDFPSDALNFLEDIPFPNLSSMEVSVPIFDLPAPFDWLRLQHLELANIEIGVVPDFHMLRALLSQCTSLLSLTLRVNLPTSPVSGIPAVMPKLTDLVLYVGNVNGQIITSIFDILAFPNLKQLVILEDEDAIWEFGLTSVVIRSGLLSKLYVNFYLPDSEWDDLLAGLPCLSEVILPWGSLMTPSTIRSISHGDLGPSLTKLLCEASNSLDLFLDMLEVRMSTMSHGTQIKDVGLIFDHLEEGCSSPDAQLELEQWRNHPRVMELKKQGVNLSLFRSGEVAVDEFVFPCEYRRTDMYDY
ncbi:hypothetical protein Hypma_014120 [Hypsizygus marmoreus]|uniref:Uncharacterized protein n=1 Tax=Hypsizygus marmoreus TaxID=39966 RepID=A0A369KEA1_HYPMA|nr:hypothetical protein Hypma_014120 [Hypsizygus marmoreus]